jgi:DNA-binding response OmpR family regulator
MPEKHLIVADDDRELADIVRYCAEGMGFTVLSAHSGREFKEAIRQCDPSAIVLDIVMPDGDGNQLLMWLIERGETAPIIVMTGYDAQYAEIASTIGVAGGLNMLGRLNKPFPLDALESMLKPILDTEAG